MTQFFDNPSAAAKAGEINSGHINEWLDLLDLTPEERERKYNATMNYADGTVVLFQVVSLHRLAREAWDRQQAAETKAAETAPVPEQFLKDVPEAVYDEPLPDLAGEIKKRLGIIACVRKFGKPQDRIRDARTEGIKVRCPNNHHQDNNPSAWCNSENNTWYCGKCVEGGDVIDFFAARRGYDVKSYKQHDFRDVVTDMGDQLGLHVIKTSSGSYEMVDDEEVWPSPLPDAPEAEPVAPRGLPTPEDEDPGFTEPEPDEPVVPPSDEPAEPITVTIDKMVEGIALPSDMLGLPDEIDNYEYNPKIPSLDWRMLPINEGTFLGQFMLYQEDYFPWVPSEYFLFVGLQAIGMAMGHWVQSVTGQTLSAASMAVLIGPSGHGKSTAVREVMRMFKRVNGPRWDPDTGVGVKIIPSPSSPEALLTSIKTEIDPPSTSTPGVKVEVPTTAWLYEDEFATLVERAKRRGGGTMKTRLIQLYDFVKSSPDPEISIEEFSLASGRRVLHDTFFTATFTTQTDAIRSMMEATDLISGFLNRIMPVMGRPQRRRMVSELLIGPDNPAHDKLYEDLWDRCRKGYKQVPFTQEALELLDSHPLMMRVERLAEEDSLYSRVFHMTCRLSLLLAVNNNEREVDVTYVAAACSVIVDYLLKCLGALRSAVIATPQDETAARILQFVDRYYKRHGRWPTQYAWSGDRSYKAVDGATRQYALNLLFEEQRLVRISLKKGGAKAKVFMIPTGIWSNFADSHGKTFNEEDVYAP